jgi:hypothetical protein
MFWFCQFVADQCDSLHRGYNPQMQAAVPRPIGVSFLVGFFIFGAAICGLTIFLLAFPETPLDFVWKLKPAAQHDLMRLRAVAIPAMFVTGSACAFAAIGLARGREWGRRMAIALIAINLLGDTINAVFRHDWRTLAGLPIGAAMIAYLSSRNLRQWITRSFTADLRNN